MSSTPSKNPTPPEWEPDALPCRSDKDSENAGHLNVHRDQQMMASSLATPFKVPVPRTSPSVPPIPRSEYGLFGIGKKEGLEEEGMTERGHWLGKAVVDVVGGVGRLRDAEPREIVNAAMNEMPPTWASGWHAAAQRANPSVQNDRELIVIGDSSMLDAGEEGWLCALEAGKKLSILSRELPLLLLEEQVELKNKSNRRAGQGQGQLWGVQLLQVWEVQLLQLWELWAEAGKGGSGGGMRGSGRGGVRWMKMPTWSWLQIPMTQQRRKQQRDERKWKRRECGCSPALDAGDVKHVPALETDDAAREHRAAREVLQAASTSKDGPELSVVVDDGALVKLPVVAVVGGVVVWWGGGGRCGGEEEDVGWEDVDAGRERQSPSSMWLVQDDREVEFAVFPPVPPSSFGCRLIVIVAASEYGVVVKVEVHVSYGPSEGDLTDTGIVQQEEHPFCSIALLLDEGCINGRRRNHGGGGQEGFGKVAVDGRGCGGKAIAVNREVAPWLSNFGTRRYTMMTSRPIVQYKTRGLGAFGFALGKDTENAGLGLRGASHPTLRSTGDNRATPLTSGAGSSEMSPSHHGVVRNVGELEREFREPVKGVKGVGVHILATYWLQTLDNRSD
ncbi:hypothetical protein DFP72DRAFT_854190 [Ephemerocybe angulata]|uniref:Uncharacterized protein n=1 Tax=Ephemerocybe angulata TaxID=980116 RepID=A0A8H6HIE8_9AGAR|nr:hypothetical protein DFP72DRAFT_854190 [Tulosesus angulatus]